MKKKVIGWILSRKTAWYRYSFTRKLNQYYKKRFYTARDRYSIAAIPEAESYIDGYTIFETTLPALLTMAAINFFKFGMTLHAKKYAEEMWFCRKLISKASRVEEESIERMDARMKERFGTNTQHEFIFEKIPDSKNSRMRTRWSGYENPENQMEEFHTLLIRESANWESGQTDARWKTVFAYITETVSDFVTKEDDPQFGPYSTPPCMRFLRWWD
jgi:hypothetical protein